MAKKNRIQSIDRALDVLEAVRDAPSAIRAVDIAAKLALPETTVHNIVRSLYYRGYLAQDEHARYALGNACLNLGNAGAKRFAHLIKPAEKYVKKIASETGDTTAVYCQYNMDLFLIASCHGRGDLIVQESKTIHDAMHRTATGKVIIAENGIDFFKQYAKRKKIKKVTDNTIIDAQAMEEQIAFYKQHGYMTCNGESSVHIASIAVPLFQNDGTFIAALGQNFPASFLLSGDRVFETRAELLGRYAKEIQNELAS